MIQNLKHNTREFVLGMAEGVRALCRHAGVFLEYALSYLREAVLAAVAFFWIQHTYLHPGQLGDWPASLLAIALLVAVSFWRTDG